MLKKVSLGILSLFLAGSLALPVQASEVVDDHEHIETHVHKEDLIDSSLLDTAIPLAPVSEGYEEIAPRMGFQWKCKTCGYVSNWHALYNTAVKYAYAHTTKNSGHETVVFGV
ncbi:MULTISPECIES: hypothetical protein [Enterococcus]|jgi:hypothetical protein|uniref:hypothetical protein n=1 Tax=Enterococcus TaxID=1350 RepID=UPI0008E9C11B|nr:MULTISPECIES: hypothetical protein [Enterococcus]SFE61788.1 hypothetical protein SAMN04487887_1212 [Enterococcus casseliflavus]